MHVAKDLRRTSPDTRGQIEYRQTPSGGSLLFDPELPTIALPCGNTSPHIVTIEQLSTDWWNAIRTSSTDTLLTIFLTTIATDLAFEAAFRTDVLGAPLFAWI